MCDPFFMFILIINLGEGYIVWDKASSIDFLKPGKGTVFAEFKISPKEISEIKEDVDKAGKKTVTFPCEVVSEEGILIARLSKDIYIRKKSPISI